MENTDETVYRREQKVSYQTFLQEQKIKLKSRYPFLAKDQINKKVKELWDHMGHNEKQNYTKTVLTKTPTRKSPNTKPRQRHNPKSTKKWDIFRDLDNESDHYENDFASQSPLEFKKSLDSLGSEDLSWLNVDSDDKSKSSRTCKNFMKTRCQLEHKIPVIVHDTPHTPQGILKGKDGGTSSEKPRVSFSSEKAQQNIYTDSENYSYTQDSSEDEYSSKLLRRNSDEVIKFDEIDQHQMNIESSQVSGLSPSEKNSYGSLEQEFNKSSDDAPNISEINSKTDLADDSKNLKLVFNDKTPEESSTDLNLFGYDVDTGDDSKVDKENKFFKSPTAKAKRTKQAKQKSCKKAKRDEILKSPLTRSMKKQVQQVTPVPDVKDGIDSYTTPLMDEIVHQNMLKEIKKAPKKKVHHIKEQNTEDNHALGNTATNKSESTRKKARTSLIGKEELDYTKHENSDEMDPTGDAKLCTEKILKRLENKLDVQDLDFSENIKSNNKSKHREKYKQSSKCRKGDFESYLLKESSPYVGNNYLEPLDVQVGSDSEESEISENLKKDCRKSNQTLVKALLKMKQVVAGAPSPGLLSVGSSPKLLSPALSGISQLSDMSTASSDSSKRNDFPENHKSKPGDEETIQKNLSEDDNLTQVSPKQDVENLPTNDGILCQMFKETRNNVLCSILSNRRMVPSNQQQTKNFTRMFMDEELFM